jgi:hypothetical protein
MQPKLFIGPVSKSVIDSVIDYALYSATYLSDIKTEGEYFEYLRQNYAEDKSYVTRLKALIKKNNLKAKFNG